MRLAHLIGPEIHDLLRDNPEDVRELLEEIHPEDLADVVLELDDDEAGALLQRLAPEAAADIFERLPEGRQEALVEKIGLLKVARIATEMSADDRADFFSALPDNVGEQLLETLERYDPEAAEEVEELTRWPETSAGHLMTTDYIETHREATADDAIKEVRRQGEDVELINYLYVVDPQERLIGIASLRDILLADPEERIEEIMVENLISVTPETDQEQVAKLMAKYDMQAVPVVDSGGVFLGIITIDDIVDVMTEEQTEDVHKLGGVQPIENPYFETTTWTFIKKRGVWLLVLFVGEMFTGTALRHFDHVIESVAQLSYYVPLLISTGGNSGGQSSTLIIRGLAVGEIQSGDWYRVLVREMVQGIALGLILGVIGMGRVLLWGDGWSFAALIGIALVSISVMGCTVGGMLPIMIKRVGIDPATSSAPFIASLVDVFGILIYFGLAQVILAQVIAQAGH
jgi:magnesium transporter